MKKLFVFLVAIIVAISLFVPEVSQAQWGSSDPGTTQTDKKSDGGSSGGYFVTGVPLEISMSLRRPFNVGTGVILSNGTCKHMITLTADVGLNFKGRQFIGLRAMYQPVKWVAVGWVNYITFGQDMSIGYGFEMGDLLGFSFMSKNTSALRVEFSIPLKLSGDAPYRHKFTFYMEPFGVFHNRYSTHNWSTPKQHYELGASYTVSFPVGGGKASKK